MSRSYAHREWFRFLCVDIGRIDWNSAKFNSQWTARHIFPASSVYTSTNKVATNIENKIQPEDNRLQNWTEVKTGLKNELLVREPRSRVGEPPTGGQLVQQNSHFVVEREDMCWGLELPVFDKQEANHQIAWLLSRYITPDNLTTSTIIYQKATLYYVSRYVVGHHISSRSPY